MKPSTYFIKKTMLAMIATNWQSVDFAIIICSTSTIYTPAKFASRSSFLTLGLAND
jgi:hypothetical protein